MNKQKFKMAAPLLFLTLALQLVATSLAEPFFLPTGEDVHNTGDPRIESDSAGNLHMAYPYVASMGAVYAWCPPGCVDENQVYTVGFSTDTAVSNAMVAVDSSDRPHVLLSTHEQVLYATCEGDCRLGANWRYGVIHEHDGNWEITGEAFTLDAQDRPRFLMHAYQAYLGMFAPEPGTRLLTCDADCLDASSWSNSLISEQTWLEPTFLYDASGVAHVATVIPVDDLHLVAYLRCDTDCSNEVVDNWPGIGLANAFTDRYIEEISPAVTMALTRSGGVRLAFLAEDDSAERMLAWFECESGCTEPDASGWDGMILQQGEDASGLGDGIDLALDALDRPRLAYTVQSSVLVATCDTDCTGSSGSDDWGVLRAELSSDIPPDEFFLYHNCTVAFWNLRQPSIALGSDGQPAVAYRAEDISVGFTNPDPTRPTCPAGVDMTMARLSMIQPD